MNVQNLSSRYTVRKLTESEIPAALSLMRGNPLFFEHCPPQPTSESVRQDMAALPPGMKPEDKYYAGFFEGGTLIALLDLILGYPEPQTAFIGFFMLCADRQGRGEGSTMVTELTDALRAAGYAHIRLGYVKSNPQSRIFWRKNRFLETGIESAAEQYTLVVLQRDLEKEATSC